MHENEVICKGSVRPLTTPMSLRKSLEETISREIEDRWPNGRYNEDFNFAETTTPHFQCE